MITFTILLPSQNTVRCRRELEKIYGDAIRFEFKAARTNGAVVITGALFGEWEILLSERLGKLSKMFTIHDYEIKGE